MDTHQRADSTGLPDSFADVCSRKHTNEHLSVLATELQQASCLFVCPSQRDISTLTGWIFMKIDIRAFFAYLLRKYVLLKADKNNGYFT